MLHCDRNSAEIAVLGTEDQVAKLSVGHEHNEEHNGEAGEIFGRLAQRQAKLGHCLVEARIFEDLDPSEEDDPANGDIEVGRPVAQKAEVNIFVRILEQRLEQIVHLNLSIQVEYAAHNREQYDNYVKYVP